MYFTIEKYLAITEHVYYASGSAVRNLQVGMYVLFISNKALLGRYYTIIIPILQNKKMRHRELTHTRSQN